MDDAGWAVSARVVPGAPPAGEVVFVLADVNASAFEPPLDTLPPRLRRKECDLPSAKDISLEFYWWSADRAVCFLAIDLVDVGFRIGLRAALAGARVPHGRHLWFPFSPLVSQERVIEPPSLTTIIEELRGSGWGAGDDARVTIAVPADIAQGKLAHLRETAEVASGRRPLDLDEAVASLGLTLGVSAMRLLGVAARLGYLRRRDSGLLSARLLFFAAMELGRAFPNLRPAAAFAERVQAAAEDRYEGVRNDYLANAESLARIESEPLRRPVIFSGTVRASSTSPPVPRRPKGR